MMKIVLLIGTALFIAFSSAFAQQGPDDQEENLFLPGTGVVKDLRESDIVVEAGVKSLRKQSEQKNPPWRVFITVNPIRSLKGTLAAELDFGYTQFHKGLDSWDSELDNGTKFLGVKQGDTMLLFLKVGANQPTISSIYPAEYSQVVAAIITLENQRSSRARDVQLLKVISDEREHELLRSYAVVNFIALAEDKTSAVKSLLRLLSDSVLRDVMRWQLAGVIIHQAVDTVFPAELRTALWSGSLSAFTNSNDPELIRDLLEFYLAVSRKLPKYGEMATALKRAIDLKRSESPKIFEQEIGGWKLNKMAEALIRRLR
jgi:hypothetical protein